MPGFLPTHIDQVHDYTEGPGGRVIGALGRQGMDPNDIYKLMDRTFGAYTQAQESDKLARAIDAARRGVESGQTLLEATSGLDPLVTGRKAFQDALDKMRSSILEDEQNERAWAQYQLNLAAENRAARQRALTEEANALEAEYDEYVNKVGAPGSSFWINANKDRLKANPLAYQRIMNKVNARGDSLLLLTQDTNPVLPTREIIEAQYNKANQDRDAYSASGLLKDLPEYRYKTFDDFINAYAKQTGDVGGDYSDLRDNMNKAYNILKGRASELGLPEEAVYLAMSRNIDPAFWWFAQDDVNIRPALEMLDKLSVAYKNDLPRYQKADRVAKGLKKVIDENIDINAQTAYQTNAARVQKLLDMGLITADQARQSLGYYNKQAQSAVQDVMRMVLEANQQ